MKQSIFRYGKSDEFAFSHASTYGWTFDSHIHTCYEILYVIEGNFFYNIEGTNYTISSGDMIITSPYELHSFTFHEKSVYERQFLHIYPEFVKDFPQLFSVISKLKFGTYNYIPSDIVNKYGLNNYLMYIENYGKKKTDFSYTMTLAYSLELIIKISEILSTTNVSNTNIETNKTSSSIKLYIDKNFKKRITLDELASLFYLDKSYICRAFKQKTGMTIKNYINMKRITYAKNKISNGEKSSTIYRECGFNDYSTFYRSFVKYVSMTPEEFKNRLKKKI